MNVNLTPLLEDCCVHGGDFALCGRVSDYIPRLAAQNPAHLSAAIVEAGGAVHAVGDVSATFSIQSISKVISLIYALMTLGRKEVFGAVGMEPTGDPYNCFIKLETAGERPFNPFINAGAITTISLLADSIGFAELMDFTREIFGGDDAIYMDEIVFAQEVAAGKRNRSMAYLMQSKGVLGDNVLKYLDYYFRLCAVTVNVTHLAHMGAVLAQGGKSPSSGRQIVPGWVVRVVKAIMLTCGMYDGSGEFAVNVGIPAKSGIGGGIVACGGDLGIGTFGPALDAKGNSIGGIKILENLSDKLRLNLFQQG